MKKVFYPITRRTNGGVETETYSVPLMMVSSMGPCSYNIQVDYEGPKTTVTHTFVCEGGAPRRMRRNDTNYYIAATYPLDMRLVLDTRDTQYDIPLRLGYCYPFVTDQIQVGNSYITTGSRLTFNPVFETGPMEGGHIFLPYDSGEPVGPLGPWLSIIASGPDLLPAFSVRHIIHYEGIEYVSSEVIVE